VTPLFTKLLLFLLLFCCFSFTCGGGGGVIVLNRNLIQIYGSSPASVTCHPTQVNAPRLNPGQIGAYSIYLPRRDGRLSWPRRLATYRDGLPACRQSPIQVLTRPGVEQLLWSDTHNALLIGHATNFKHTCVYVLLRS